MWGYSGPCREGKLGGRDIRAGEISGCLNMEGEMKDLILAELIESKIYLIRGHKVMIDRDLAAMYGVETRVLNQAVRRNIDRFPATSCLP